MIISPAMVLRAPQLTSFSSTGSYTYTIPQWASHIDVILLGGGGGGREGNGGNNTNGDGGYAGNWQTRTLERGLDIPWATTSITGVVGSAGPSGPIGSGDRTVGGKGGDSTAVYTGITLTGPGGNGGSGFNSFSGGSPGTFVVNNNSYVGGAAAPTGASATNGNPPGGGGGGGRGGIFGDNRPGMAGSTGAVYFYAYMKANPPRAFFNDTLDSLGSFSVTSNGSGIASTGGEATWNGTTDGQSLALYSSRSTTNNQYVAGVAGSALTGNGSVIVFHCDASFTNYYGASIYNGGVNLIRTSGMWTQNAITDIVKYTGTINTGDSVELWNIGETFRVSVNGVLRIEQVISGALIGDARRFQGFGMYRVGFVNSSRLANWSGGDALAWGKT